VSDRIDCAELHRRTRLKRDACTVRASSAVGAGPGLLIDDPLVARAYQVVPTDVTVRNDGGVITLNGFIEGIGREQGIVGAVASIDGVRRVDSNLIVRADDD